MGTALFAFFAALSVLACLGVVLLRDPIKGAMSLIVAFFALASLFVLQAAELMAMLEILVYAGAIMVLFVFVLMLVEDKAAPLVSPEVGQKVLIPVKLAAVAAVGLAMVAGMSATRLGLPATVEESFGGPASVGRHFFSAHLFHFEMTSVLLLGAIVGAVGISRRGRPKDEPDRELE